MHDLLTCCGEEVEIGSLVKMKTHPNETWSRVDHPFWKTKPMGVVLRLKEDRTSYDSDMTHTEKRFILTAEVMWCDGVKTETNRDLLEVIVGAK